MPVPEEVKRELCKEFDKHLQKALRCPMTPGSLEEILARAGQEMDRFTQEALAQAASDEADFPPSGVSPLRPRAPVQSEAQAQEAGDDVGGDSL